VAIVNSVRRLVLALVIVCGLAWPAWPQALLTFPDGALAGDVTDSRAVVWGRVNGPAAVRVEYGPFASLGQRTEPVRAEPASDFAVKVDLSGLRPGSRYYYRMSAESGARQTSTLVGSFKTAPTPADAAEVSFVWGGDTSERFQPFRIYDAMRARQPDFFLFLGDTIYADIDGNARTLEDYRGAYRRNRDDEPFRRFARAASIYVIWDDHEVFNNFDRTEPRLPAGRQAFLENWPLRQEPSDPTRLYRSFRWGRLLELFILDTRQYRSPSTDRDNAQKSMLGSAQKEWLKRSLAASTATFKVIATSVTLKYHGSDSWEGYKTERGELFDFIVRNNIRGVVFLAADVHYAAVLRHKQGFVESYVGPLGMLISSDRAAAGQPETEFSSNSSFTFGLVRVNAQALVIEIYDVEGRLLHKSTVQP
jgi:alkaline phosphatase D